jgi:hypothetical protein
MTRRDLLRFSALAPAALLPRMHKAEPYATLGL